MKLQLIGHEHRYSVEQAVVAFLNRKASLCEEIPPEYTGDRLISKLSYGEKYITASAELIIDGERYLQTSRSRISDVDSASKRIGLEQHVLKQAVFKAVKQATGTEFPWGSLTGMRPTTLVLRMLEDGKTQATARRELIEKYKIFPERAKMAVEAASQGLAWKQRISEKDISLYVGIPFCPTRCSYCSFVSSEIEKSRHLIEPYLEKLCDEIRQRGELVKELGLRITSVYIGGGTPTSISASQLDKLLSEISGAFELDGVQEYTVEAGRPDTITLEKLRVIKSYGVERLSINPQSMAEDVLVCNRRSHTPDDVLRAFEQARSCGFDCINMDTIAGLPGDSVEGFKATLRRLEEIRPENITVHTLALKRGSELTERAGQDSRPDDVTAMLDFAHDFMYNVGYRPYYLYRQKYMAASLENIGWTLPNKESIYNICSMEEFQTIISMGAGAITKLVSPDGKKIKRLANNKFPAEYIESDDKIISNGRKIRSFFLNIIYRGEGYTWYID